MPGVMSADPKRISNAIVFEELPYQEASEMTYYGASVIHPKTIKPLANANISLLVKNNTNSPANISVQGKIEMPDGKKEKEYSPWSSDKLSGEMEKSYAPSLSAGMHLISFWLVNSSCNDTDESNNNAVRLIAVLGSSSDFEEGKNTDSSLEIEEVSVGKDEFAAWGESIPVKIEIYKGNT